MSGKFLLDTNIVIALFADEAIVKDNLAQAGETFIPSIVIGELCYGARKSGRVETNLARVDELVGLRQTTNRNKPQTQAGIGIYFEKSKIAEIHTYQGNSQIEVNSLPRKCLSFFCRQKMSKSH